jgi:hypothetical protein
MRSRARVSGRFSRREMVDCEHRSRPDGRRSSAILNNGSRRRLVASLPSAYPAAIASRRKRMISARRCAVRSGSRGSAMQAASRSATPSRRSISRRTSTPPSDEREPPSKRATMSFSATGDRPGSGSVESTMAGGRSGNGGDRLQQPNPMRNGLRYTRQPLMHNCGYRFIASFNRVTVEGASWSKAPSHHADQLRMRSQLSATSRQGMFGLHRRA